MAANTGKTHNRWTRVWVDDVAAGTARDISTDVTSVDIPIVYETQDVTGYSDGVDNFQLGHPSVNITMSGNLNNTATTGSHIVLSGIVGIVDDDGSNAPYTVTVQYGIRKAPETGDPEFEGEFYCSEYNLSGDLTWTATFVPASSTLPAWGTMA